MSTTHRAYRDPVTVVLADWHTLGRTAWCAKYSNIVAQIGRDFAAVDLLEYLGRQVNEERARP
jgi:hypothetical protein